MINIGIKFGYFMDETFAIGWEEWISLGELGLPAIKAKTDTGAKTSALHAVAIEPFGSDANPQVRFIMHPDPSNPQVEIVCSAKVVDRRTVISSNGVAESRFVIRSPITVGSRTWDIDITLTNRETMGYRMLLGRSALADDMSVVPSQSFIQPELDYNLYKSRRKKARKAQPLRIAILTQEPQNYSNGSMIKAAEARGHVIECIETSRCYMSINAHKPEVYYDGKALPRYDAVIPRIGSRMTFYGMAVVRQFESMGVFCLNAAQSIGNSRDKLLAHQVLASHRLGMPNTAFARSSRDTDGIISLAGGSPVVVKLLESTQGKGVVLAETRKAATSLIDAFRGLDAHFLVQEFIKEASGTDLRCLVVNGKVVGSMIRTAQAGEFRSNLHQGGSAKKAKLSRAERSAAIKAARALKLNVAGVDILRSDSGPKILEVNSSPGLKGIEQATGVDVAGQIIECIESNVVGVFHAPKPQKVVSKKHRASKAKPKV